MLAGVVINEFHYDPDDATEKVEFIELHNSDAANVDLSGWRIDEAVNYTFPVGANIAAGGYVVVAQDASAFQAKFGIAPDGQWETGDRLANEGETIELRDAANQLVDTVTYKLGFPWPTTGDTGSSLELIHPSLDNDVGGSWRSSGFKSQSTAPTTLVAASSLWSYRKGITQNPPVGWQLTSFNPASDPVAWQSGGAPIGYGATGLSTTLTDMRNNYTTVYLRKDFTIAGDVPNALKLRMFVDDGAIVWINGFELPRFHVTAGDKNFNGTSGQSHNAAWEELTLANANSYLVAGTNMIAVHILNTQIDSSDLVFNVELSVPGDSAGPPTPGVVNSVYATNSPPQMRQLTQSVAQPMSGQAVTLTMKVTDPDGVQSVSLQYQLVDPGSYIRRTDAAYQTNWTTVAMHDDGLDGNSVAGDGVYSVVLPGSLQVNRRLVRYRITATDNLGASVRGPYADDPQPNFAYFVYNGVPDYTASLQPGVLPNVTYSGGVLDNIATYQLVASASDVQNSQYSSTFNEVPFLGTFVYDGVVYDHIEFRNRGQASTYVVGKNKWKIEFRTGHALQARDNYGKPYDELWDEINIQPGTNPWWRNDVSTEGTVLFEPVAYRLYELAGTPSPQTHYLNFRVIDGASATGGDQYSGDYWGLYIGVEQPDGSFLDDRGLPDGNMYNVHGSAFGSTTQRHQGANSPSDRSDLVSFLAGIDGGFETLTWWEQNLNWDSYFAWNIINHVANNSDIRPDENVNYYHNEATGQWYVLPWDLDLTFEDAPHHGNPVTNRENIRSLMRDHPLAKLAYENRLREIVDLLLNNHDAARVVVEFANLLTFSGTDQTLVNANQAQWDYHPQKVKKGIWYKNFNPSLLPSQTFNGLVSYMQTFLDPGGYGYNQLTAQGNDAGIPNKPTIAYTGSPGFPLDGLAFQTSAFSDPQGAATFAKMEWRVAELYNPLVAGYQPGTANVYELEGTWESGELVSFSEQMNVPASALEAGKTYRARVRMQDINGHWSHWSDAIEFAATPAISIPTLAISEIHYHPAAQAGVDDEDDLEFIELVNFGSQPVNLAGVQIKEFASTPYTFGDGLNLEAGHRVVVPRNPSVFQQVYGTSIPIAGGGFGTGNLSNGGERISLVSALGATIVDFNFHDEGNWPTAPDGNGPSLENINPAGDPSDPANWKASLFNGGSPGAPNQLLPGDYDRNGAVEEADYGVWLSSAGSEIVPFEAADGNGNGVVDAADYIVWRKHVGATAAGSSPSLVVAVAPAVDLSSNDEISGSVRVTDSESMRADTASARRFAGTDAVMMQMSIARASLRRSRPLHASPVSGINVDMQRLLDEYCRSQMSPADLGEAAKVFDAAVEEFSHDDEMDNALPSGCVRHSLRQGCFPRFKVMAMMEI